MIGTKFNKSDYDVNAYAECSMWCDENNATIEDKGDYYEVVPIVISLEDVKFQAEATIKAKLSATDYKCLKYVDGELSEEEYSKTKNERSKLRELYNSIGVATTIEKVETILEEVSHAGGSD